MTVHARASILTFLVLCLVSTAIVDESGGMHAPEFSRATDVWDGSERDDTTEATEPPPGLPLRAFLQEIGAETGTHFLYRDAIVAGIRVQPSRPFDNPLDALGRVLDRHGLELKVSPDGTQGIITRAQTSTPTRRVQGQVVDAETGIRLPHATLLWTEAGERRGRAADAEGTFRIPLTEPMRQQDRLEVTVSYVGYHRQTVSVDPGDPPPELTIRLHPTETTGPEVVVESYALQSTLDTTWRALTHPERYAPLGEASVLSVLQSLPAVGIGPILSGELNVRGSRNDGFHVQLDGMSIYNQNHLFGLFDAFNEEALTTVGLYYGVAPAQYSAPPGGTLAFQTRTGSQRRFHGGGEVSPTAISGTAEGPIGDGRGSWLLSARRSVLGLDWFGNPSLISQGLGVDRRRESLPPSAREVGAQLFDAAAPSAHFYDVHAKAFWETDSGHRITLNGYVGNDDAKQGGERYNLDESPTPRERFRRDFVDTTSVRTTNEWGNVGASIQWMAPIGNQVVSQMTGALSRYHGEYRKDDFLYTSIRSSSQPRFFLDRFSHENQLREASLEHQLDIFPSYDGTWTVGYSGRLYRVTYSEVSPVYSSFNGSQEGLQFDVYGQYDVPLQRVDLQVGLRSHYFSQGRYLRWSPRVKARFFPHGPLSIGVGYSRNHQFLHRLELVNEVSSAVWIPSTERQPPGSADHLMAGLYTELGASTHLQAQAYWKAQENVRLHQTVTRLQRSSPSILFDPWSVRNDLSARGVELMLRHKMGPVDWTTSYALSRVELEPAGTETTRPADWDRRHQLMTRLAWSNSRASVHLTWWGGTGVPNPYARYVPREPSRLGSYHRLDLGASLGGTMGRTNWTVRASLVNAYDRDNPWYRTPEAVWRPDGPDPNRRPEFDFVFLDVYDLGIRPSMTASIRW